MQGCDRLHNAVGGPSMCECMILLHYFFGSLWPIRHELDSGVEQALEKIRGSVEVTSTILFCRTRRMSEWVNGEATQYFYIVSHLGSL